MYPNNLNNEMKTVRIKYTQCSFKKLSTFIQEWNLEAKIDMKVISKSSSKRKQPISCKHIFIYLALPLA